MSLDFLYKPPQFVSFQMCQGRKEAGRAVFYRALQHCPWAKVGLMCACGCMCVPACVCVPVLITSSNKLQFYTFVVSSLQNCLCICIVVWLNASQRSQVGVGINKSAQRCSVKRFERSNRLDTVLYKIIPTPFIVLLYCIIVLLY